MSGPDRPPDPRSGAVGATILGLAGAGLIGLQSLYTLLVAGSVPFSLEISVPWFTPVAGTLGAIDASVLAAVSLLLYFWPRAHVGLGIALITFSVLSLNSGGGFLLGALLAYVGGVVAIGLRPGRWRGAPGDVSLSDADDDPVIEADLVDSGLLPRASAECETGGPSLQSPP
ncbi:MAG: hypothetical protein ACLQD8_03975 [Thermoplasmata archaeon]